MLRDAPVRVLYNVSSSRNATRRRLLSRPTSTSPNLNPYPFPSTQDPTPYQIFHLSTDATTDDIKQRYYELVRFYHPDAASARQREPDASRRHTHFSAITRAYASLQKRSSDGVTDEKEESRRAHSVWQRPPHTRSWRNFEEAANADERWKDRLIWGGLCFTLIAVTGQYLTVRHQNMKTVLEHTRGESATGWRPSDARRPEH